MQFSLAQYAADKFIGMFFNGGGSLARRASRFLDEFGDVEAQEAEVAKLRYVTDWLHFWLLTGDARDATDGDVTVYLQSVAIIFAHAHVAKYMELAGIFPPSDTEARSRDPYFIFTSPRYEIQGYEIPSAILPEMYNYCLRLEDDHRLELLKEFFADPGRYRVNFRIW